MDSPVRQLFLSYSRPDQDQVEEIAIRLDQAGYRVWFDQARLVPGDAWSDQLDEALWCKNNKITMRDVFI